MAPDDQTATIRQLDSAKAAHLAALATVLDDLNTVMVCCGLLLDHSTPGPADEAMKSIQREALWTTALISYSRCFLTKDASAGLTEEDVTSTALEGEVLEWHAMLQRMRGHYTDPGQNPRAHFNVGAVTGDNEVTAIAITSTEPSGVDERTARQTGALALELSKIVDRRITEQQEQVLTEANNLTDAALSGLPLIDIREDSLHE